MPNLALCLGHEHLILAPSEHIFKNVAVRGDYDGTSATESCHVTALLAMLRAAFHN